jgi:catechol 2,3-dioxygenase-like lactoylglutathione lyase family enzyme
MIFGGSVTLAVSDFERAVEFYSETLGLKLNMRFGDQWAVLDAGRGLLIALPPKSDDHDLGASMVLE